MIAIPYLPSIILPEDAVPLDQLEPSNLEIFLHLKFRRDQIQLRL